MDFEKAVKIAGAIMIIVYLFFGIDDIIWYLYSTISKLYKPKDPDAVLDFKKLYNIPPKMLAVTIAAWHESNVIEGVLTNFINTTYYPKSMYHIFVGVYPNDPETIECVNRISQTFPNVHAIINEIEGPTTKAQNLNWVIKQIKIYEAENHVSFASLTVHDSEDVVHTYELLATNYLIDKHIALQFPVFPILEMPKLSNFFRQLTTATYADEFAENHYTTLVDRNRTGAFVPCAGTGFALSKQLIDSYNGEDVFPMDALTEDYLLSISLYKNGMPLHYVLNKLPRVLKSGKIKTDFITTRSLFPTTFKAAVKQKTRWTYGIAMQSVGIRDIFTTSKVSFAGRYSFYKDVKTKMVNLVPLVGYIFLVYCILTYFFDLPHLYDYGTPIYYMALCVFTTMLIRQAFRGYALFRVYGFRSMFYGILFPPVFPIRLVYGNIINLTATLKAYKLRIFGTKKKTARKKVEEVDVNREGKKKKVAWAKTDHEFLTRDQLRSYRRMLGDYMITWGYITPKQFKSALAEAQKNNEYIGEYFTRTGAITNEDFLKMLGHVKHIQYIPNDVLVKLDYYKTLNKYDAKKLISRRILPLAEDETTIYVGVDELTNDDDIGSFSEETGKVCRKMFITDNSMSEAYSNYHDSAEQLLKLDSLKWFDKGIISFEQVILAGTYAEYYGEKENIILNKMGIMVGEAV